MPKNQYDLDRRKFIKLTGAATLGSAIGTRGAFAAESPQDLYRRVIPIRKGLDASWATSLVKRGAAKDQPIRAEQSNELSNIGMTVGGIGCGTVYLSGDGQLYVWDIFHRPNEGVVAQRLPKEQIPKGLEVLGGHKKIVRERDGSNYIKPPTPDRFPNPFRQEFILEINGEKSPRPMRQDGWKQVKFTGQWPLGTVDYSDPGTKLTAQLDAWTPFIPLDTANSSIPVTVMDYTLTNTGDQAISGKLTGIWENPVLVYTRKKETHAVGTALKHQNGVTLMSHFLKTKQIIKAGDFGTATLACLDHADANKTNDGLVRSFELEAGQSLTVTYLLCWHFPQIRKLHRSLGPQQPHYTKQYQDADDVAIRTSKQIDKLRESTMRWVKTWNDSTLPQWLLDRSILTTNTLQTATCEVLAGDDYPDGRFWAWEGIGCCPGTCAHVWHYAQGVAHLFPSLERNLREITDYGIAINKDGSIRF
ncbi:MAG: hypothetical protein KJO79_01205, partial [Verrucomicrobiae bacterium]|nr:hypothetical protein [Verrucomicrobiae bacterium]NNJ85763.1 hypothetical protein [Akkermansiaceae bacterium]